MADELYDGIDNLEVLADAVRYNRFLVDLVLAESRGSKTAVDFGAGTGSISVQVRSRGLELQCVEADPRLRELLGRQELAAHKDLSAFADGSLPYIYSLNVLEHIEDDAACLRQIYRKLQPGGRLLLYVPALQMLYSSMDRKVGHYRRYHRGGLRDLATAAGFDVERLEYADSLGFKVTLLYKLIGSRTGEVNPGAVRIYDRFIFPLSRLFDRIGMSHLLGKNLLAVLVKR